MEFIFLMVLYIGLPWLAIILGNIVINKREQKNIAKGILKAEKMKEKMRIKMENKNK